MTELERIEQLGRIEDLEEEVDPTPPPAAKKSKKQATTLPAKLPASLARRRLPERNAVIDTQMPSGLPSAYSLEGDKDRAGVRADLMAGLASGDPAVKSAAIERTKQAYLKQNPKSGRGLASRLDGPLQENAIAWAMGDEAPSQLRQGLAALNRGVGMLPAMAVGAGADVVANVGLQLSDFWIGDKTEGFPLGSTFQEQAEKRRIGNAEAQTFDRFDKRGTLEKAKDVGKAIWNNPGAFATGLAEMATDPSEVGVELLTSAVTGGLGKLGAVKRAGEALKAASQDQTANKLIRGAAYAGRAAAPTAEVVAGAALQPALERGTVTSEDMASGLVASGALRTLGPLARYADEKLGLKAKREAIATPAAAPSQPLANEFSEFGAAIPSATAPAAPVAAAADDAALAGFRRTVGADAVKDPETGLVTYGPGAKAALREAIVKGRSSKNPVDQAAGKAAEDLVNSHAQTNPDNWADELAQATAMGELYQLGGGTQTFVHTVADGLADIAPAKPAAAPKALTPQQQARVRDAMDQYIKKDEVLDDMDLKTLKKRAAENKYLADRGMLPEDAHQSFSRIPDRDAEFNRIASAQAAKRGEELKIEESATQQARDNEALAVGESLVRRQLSQPEGVGLLDKAGVKALADALEADARVQGGFRDQLVDLFGEERVRMFEDASLAPSNRHEWQKGALTGENPLEAIQRRQRQEAEEEQASTATAEQRAKEQADKTAKAEAERRADEKYNEDAKAYDDSEKKRFANEQKQNLFRDDVEALARIQNTVQVDRTGKAKPSSKPVKAEAKDAAERTRLGSRLAKHLSESEPLEAIVADALPSQFRAEFDDLMGSIRNMDGKNQAAMQSLGKFLSLHSTSLAGKIPQVNVQRPRPFPKKASPSEE